MGNWHHKSRLGEEWLVLEGSEVSIHLSTKDRPDVEPYVDDGEYPYTADEALKRGQDLIEAAMLLKGLKGENLDV